MEVCSVFVGRFRLWRAIIAAGCLQIICMQEDTHPNIPKKLEIRLEIGDSGFLARGRGNGVPGTIAT